MGELSPWHLLILAGVFVLLFGAKRLPDASRSLGRSLRIFKTEVKGLNDDEQPAQVAAAPPAVAPPAVPPAAPTATTDAAATPPAAVQPVAPPAAQPPASEPHESR
jgi:sec-independent protein translocase protein TatA